jgi:hypothetical protein
VATNKYLIDKAQPPALPLPPKDSSYIYLSTLNNILRLFFNRIANSINLVTGEYGAQYLSKPNGLFFSITTQPLTTVNVAQDVSFEVTYLSEGLVINGGSNTELTARFSGIYNFQFSGQVYSSSANPKNVYLWIARDGTDIGYSTRQYVLSGSGDATQIAWSFNIDLQAGQYIELRWSADDINVELEAQAASSPHPGIPSAVVTVTFVSALPETLPTPP